VIVMQTWNLRDVAARGLLAASLAFVPLSAGAARAQEAGGLGDLAALEEAYIHAADQVAPAVVQIVVERERADLEKAGEKGDGPNYLARPEGPVTGVIVDAKGYVATSAWAVLAGKSFSVVLPDGGAYAAKLLGKDEALDLALLKIEGDGSPVQVEAARLADGPARVGQLCVLVARAPGGGTSVNTGIVSAVDRFRGSALQVDAAINLANTGGAIVDIDGRLLGIATRPTTQNGINSGVGFAAPVSKIKSSLPALVAGRGVPRAKRPFLGVQGGKELLDPPGVQLAKVVEGSAAEKAGLKDGDIIRSIEGVQIVDFFGLSEVLASKEPGDPVKLMVERDGASKEMTVVLGERTDGE